MAELVYAYVSEAYGVILESSSLSMPTIYGATLRVMSLGVRDLSRRRKINSKGFPTKKSVAKDALDILIYPIAIGAPLAMLPQVINLYATRDASSLVLITWLLFGCFNLIWILYGWVHKERPILLTNTMLAFLNFSIVFGILLYR